MKRSETLFLASVLLAGCADPEVFSEPRESVVRREADLYCLGPAQPGPPEKLPRGTLIHTLRKDSAYSFVKLGDGRTGYLDSSDIAPAPPTAPAVPFDPPETLQMPEPVPPDLREVPAELPPL
jgi:hypothetical protein